VIHPAAIVDHSDQSLAARLRFDANRTCPGINRVFEKLFDNRRRPLDNFASRNLVRDIFSQYAYARHIPLEGRSLSSDRAACYFGSNFVSLIAIPKSSSWSVPTSDGDSAIRSWAFVVFGNAITSRIDFSPASSITTRSSPSAIPP
jgi:hypothetical protein